MNENRREKIYKIASIALCSAMIVIAILLLFTPILHSTGVSILPYDFLVSISISDIDFGYLNNLMVSYYVNKYYFMIYGVVGLILVFLTLYYIITKSKKLFKNINNIMIGFLLIIFIAMLVGINFINIYHTINSTLKISTSAIIYFILAVVLLIGKFTLDFLFGRELIKDEIKESGLSIVTAFALMFLVISSIFFPLYIFPGTRYRLSGIDMIFNGEDVLEFLPMSGTYKFIIIAFLILNLVSFIINIFFYLKKRNIFTLYNKVNNLIGVLSLILYAFMGLNYIIVYLDANAYSTFFNTSINTYSYIPILLLIIYWIGVLITKMTAANLNIEYKIYAKQEGKLNGAGTNQGLGLGIDEDNNADPIPAFAELDRKEEFYKQEYERRLANSFDDVTLPKLVKHIIEYARYSEDRLSYGPVEIKTFIAGLAASRLTILQGMSGTGKTSLPKIFMESIDGICDLVAVESSWRDKNELLGFYSEFKRKYTPKSFTQFLYKATLNKDIPFFIVLDEMNLSRIEYYFSDFLSIMESRENNRYIKLFDIQLYPLNNGRSEYLGLRDGHTIDIPTNIWFIGTANRDESTFEISDKVYDRAQTMNFNKRASKIYIEEQINYPTKFVSYQKLRELFNESMTIGFDAENYEVIKKVENLLKPYNISFGNRILNQIEIFVNAYVSCSEIGSNSDQNRYIHEAVDCIIYSKVVRKLELKQIMDIDLLIEEFENLGLTKCSEFLHTLIESI